MAAVVYGFTVRGIEGQLVEIEVETMLGVNQVSIVGLGDKAVKEARDRLEAAVIHSGFIFPIDKIVFNLAPSDLKKTGTQFELAMAIALLVRTKQIKICDELTGMAFIGELSLNGNLRPSNGVLPMTMKAMQMGINKIFVPKENLEEAELVRGIDIIGCGTLREVVDILAGDDLPIRENKPTSKGSQSFEVDFAEVSGQEDLLEYIMIAAAGGHNLLMMGPPGCGKSMIAKRIPTILPDMSEEEALEVTKIYSVADLLTNKELIMMNRPFRSPHHSASTNALIGGGPYAKPGEISLAHHGVLFLDEMTEFSRKTLDALRQPLEDQSVTVTRVWGSNMYPANFMLVGAMNPCLCGYFGQERCRCTDYEMAKYRQRLSGPLLDRLDIQKHVRQVDFFKERSGRYNSATMREKVKRARSLQRERYKDISGIYTNAQTSAKLIKEYCPIDTETKNLLSKVYERFGYSARSMHKFIQIARTIADLDGETCIRMEHMRKSLQSRDFDKESWQFTGARYV